MTRVEELKKYKIDELIYSGDIVDLQIIIGLLVNEVYEKSYSAGYKHGYDECEFNYQENEL